MAPRKQTAAPAKKVTSASITPAQAVGRKVTRTLRIETGTDALSVADAIAKRVDPPMDWAQVNLDDFTAERIAGPRDANARWRFNIPGQLLVVAEADLPIIRALINALDAEKEAKQL